MKVTTAWRNRGFPDSLEALRHAKASYSMHGEDMVAASLLLNYKGDRKFVDIGCFDPIRWSNTYFFYLRGWRGICVDVNDRLSDRWRKLRPHDTFLARAVGDGGCAFYREHDASPASNEVRRSHDGTHSGPERQVSPVRLESLLREWNGNGDGIGLMSVDCEGMDLEVLSSNDWNRYRPAVLIVEDNEMNLSGPVVGFCESVGYALHGLVGTSLLFRDQETPPLSR